MTIFPRYRLQANSPTQTQSHHVQNDVATSSLAFHRSVVVRALRKISLSKTYIFALLFFLSVQSAFNVSFLDNNYSRSLYEKVKQNHHHHPIVVFYEASCEEDEEKRFCDEHNVSLQIPPKTSVSDVLENAELSEQKHTCVPMSEWHQISFQGCNKLHEIDILMDKDVTFLAEGGRRSVWKVQQKKYDSEREESFVLKTLKFDTHDFNGGTLRSNRRDAIISERLTRSPYVANIYGYCAQSVMNEMASTDLEHIISTTNLSWSERLRYARDAARAVADMRSIDDPAGRLVSFSHNDMGPQNFIIMNDANNQLKIHDFNAAFFFKWNTASNSMCDDNIHICNKYRAPEQCHNHSRKITGKEDVYALGHILHYILTGNLPYSYPKRLKPAEGAKLVKKGIKPVLPPDIVELANVHGNKAVLAILSAMEKCYQFMAEDRPTAHEIAKDLSLAWKEDSMAVYLLETDESKI